MKTVQDVIQEKQNEDKLVVGAVAGAYVELTVEQINDLNAKLMKSRLKVTPLFAAGFTDSANVYLCRIENHTSVFTIQ